MIRALAHVDAMSPYALSDPGGAEMISLAQNESAFAPSPAAVAAGQAIMTDAALYPDPEWHDLRAAIACVHGLNPAQILCGAGSMELIGCLIHAYAGHGYTVVGSQYGYAFVATACAQARAGYVTAGECDLTVAPRALLEAVTAETRIVFLCNPGNPTGTLIPNGEIVQLRRHLPDNVLLVVDQAYGEFSDSVEPPSEVFELVGRGDTVVLRTFSKAYGLAGARVGWALAPNHIATDMRKLLNPNNISEVSQAMATAAMRDQSYMRYTVAKTAVLRDGFAQSLRDLGIAVPAGHTNFALLSFADATVARRVDEALQRDNLLLRGMSGYGLPACLRATISIQAVMDRVLHVIKRSVT